MDLRKRDDHPPFIKTGMTQLDAALDGGLMRGSVTGIFAVINDISLYAAENIVKTAMSDDLNIQICLHDVCHSPMEFTRTLTGVVSGVPLRSSGDYTDNELAALAEAQSFIAGSRLTVDTVYGMTAEGIFNSCVSCKSFRPDLLIIDSDGVNSSVRFITERTDHRRAQHAFSELARALHCAIIICGRLGSRTVWLQRKNAPSDLIVRSALAESPQPEDSFGKMILLHRPSFYHTGINEADDAVNFIASDFSRCAKPVTGVLKRSLSEQLE
jgi:hypothetical protein